MKNHTPHRFQFKLHIKDGLLQFYPMALNGGKISTSQIDELSEYPDETEIQISGLHQDTFEYFVENFGNQFKYIHFWKCPRIEDLSPLEKLTRIEKIEFYWNQKVTQLWNLEKNPALNELHLGDFNKITDLEGIEKSKSLKKLEFGFFIHPKFDLISLEPLSKIENLEILSFNAKKVPPEDYKWLTLLPNLKELNIPFGMFKTIELAWIKARLKEPAKSAFWDATIVVEPIKNERTGKSRDTFIVGKRKPRLDSKADEKRIAKYTKEYSDMVSWFESNPGMYPEDYK